MATSKAPISVKFEPEDREMIEREADRDERSISSLIRSIVLPELRRREHNRETTDRQPLHA